MRLLRAFTREQREALTLAAKVRMAVLVPVMIWLLASDMPDTDSYLWRFASVAILFVMSVLHLWAARYGRQLFRATYALLAVDIAITAFFFAYPNPFMDPPVPAAMHLRENAFFWFLFFVVHAAFSTNWRLVVWTGVCIMLARALQVAWIAALPETITEIDYPLQTAAGWVAALGEPNFVFVFARLGDVVGAGSFTVAVAFLVWRSHRILERQILAERARAQIARYVPTSLVDEIMAEGDHFIAARQADVGVLFVDVVGFTRMAERFTPVETVRFLRALHKRLAEAVFAHNGTIDKYLGDGLMATFGTAIPRSSKTDVKDARPRNDAADAIAAGLAMVEAVAAWNALRTDLAPIRIGVGIDFGPATIGDVGDERRLEFTVIGDTVNIASRVEELTREANVPLLVTARAVAMAKAAGDGALTGMLRQAGTFAIRGRRGKVRLFELAASRKPVATAANAAASSGAKAS